MGLALIVLGMMLLLAAHVYSGILYSVVSGQGQAVVRGIDRFMELNLISVFDRAGTVMLLVLFGFIAAYALQRRGERARRAAQVPRKIAI